MKLKGILTQTHKGESHEKDVIIDTLTGMVDGAHRGRPADELPDFKESLSLNLAGQKLNYEVRDGKISERDHEDLAHNVATHGAGFLAATQTMFDKSLSHDERVAKLKDQRELLGETSRDKLDAMWNALQRVASSANAGALSQKDVEKARNAPAERAAPTITATMGIRG